MRTFLIGVSVIAPLLGGAAPGSRFLVFNLRGHAYFRAMANGSTWRLLTPKQRLKVPLVVRTNSLGAAVLEIASQSKISSRPQFLVIGPNSFVRIFSPTSFHALHGTVYVRSTFKAGASGG